MSHDSRYEKECPQHGWYLDVDGCEECQQADDVERQRIDLIRQKIRTALMLYSAECWEIAASLPKNIEPYTPTLVTRETAVPPVREDSGCFVPPPTTYGEHP